MKHFENAIKFGIQVNVIFIPFEIYCTKLLMNYSSKLITFLYMFYKFPL